MRKPCAVRKQRRDFKIDNQIDNDKDELVSVTEAAELLGVAHRTLLLYIEEGRLEAIRPALPIRCFPYLLRLSEVERLKGMGEVKRKPGRKPKKQEPRAH